MVCLHLMEPTDFIFQGFPCGRNFGAAVSLLRVLRVEAAPQVPRLAGAQRLQRREEHEDRSTLRQRCVLPHELARRADQQVGAIFTHSMD